MNKKLGGCQHCGAYGLTPHTRACQEGRYVYRQLLPKSKWEQMNREAREVNHA